MRFDPKAIGAGKGYHCFAAPARLTASAGVEAAPRAAGDNARADPEREATAIGRKDQPVDPPVSGQEVVAAQIPADGLLRTPREFLAAAADDYERAAGECREECLTQARIMLRTALRLLEIGRGLDDRGGK